MSRARDVSRFLPLAGAKAAVLAKKSGADFDIEWVERLAVRAAVYMGSSPPGSPQHGDLWWNTVKGQLYLLYQDDDSTQWVLANSVLGSTGGPTPGEGDSTHFQGSTPPVNPKPGDFWFNDTTGKLYVRYSNNGAACWVQIN